ncbi:MAG: PIN domain-containing protein [Bryobacteraceae bacterium]
MSLIVLLDSGPLGMITNPRNSPENEACKTWLASLAYNGVEVVIPEIADYEVRRELLRAGKARGLGRLDALKSLLEYAPITTPVMLKAAEFWASARKMGRQAAVDASLDADMILAAQARALVRIGDETVIATANVGHLALFSPARIWREIG